MNAFKEETDWFHVFANPPGVHGRLMATVESEQAAKAYLFDLVGVPVESWKPRQVSGKGRRVDIWISRDTQDARMTYEDAGTYFTLERVRVVRVGSSLDSHARLET